ncbi:MAG: serine--tRNA ligase [Candidatus Nealsonbacteria bacterium]
MLDIKFIRQNPDKVKEGCRKKQVKIDINTLLELDRKRRNYLKDIESLRSEKKKLARAEIKKAKELKKQIKEIEPELKKIETEFNDLMLQVPNLPQEGVPEGKDESDNVVLRELGEKPKFNFAFKDYLEISRKLNLIDIKRAAKVSGTRFGYLKNEAVLLEFALVNFAFEELKKENFIPVIPPVIVKPEIMQGMGYMERGREEMYFIERDNLYLIGTAEQIIGPMHSREIFKEKELPRRYVGFSSCFRREAGSYGKDTRGILRVHQFDKIEMFTFCRPEESKKEHQLLLSLEEKFMENLKIPYRVVQMCTGDLGDPAAAKYDIESWIPSENRYRETHSTSNCTDFQARRLNIRYKDKAARLNFVHTLNGTAFAIGRTLIAIIENYQQKDGSIKVPQVLQKYTNFKKVG